MCILSIHILFNEWKKKKQKSNNPMAHLINWDEKTRRRKITKNSISIFKRIK